MEQPASELTGTALLQDLPEVVQDWAMNQVLVTDTLIEVFLIALAGLAAYGLTPHLRRLMKPLIPRERDSRLILNLKVTLDELLLPLLWLAGHWLIIGVSDASGLRHQLPVITSSLLSAWVFINLATSFVSQTWAHTIAWAAWSIAALNIVGLLGWFSRLLDQAALEIGQIRISALTVLEGLVSLTILLWLGAVLAQLIEGRLNRSPNLTPSIQVLAGKLTRMILITVAVVFALGIIGVDLTALAVFGGAIGVGIGFGLQKIFANLISGIILLLDKSIKPGDVIAVPGYYGQVQSLGARYVSVYTRDGIEHLIPNEELIANRVENWSHSHNLLRLRVKVGVHYKADVHKARELCLEAASETPRILDEPSSNCLLRGFGDSSVDLEIRFWINDPMNGRANVTSELLLKVWDKFHEHGVEIPYPQRDLHLRSSDI